MAEWHFFASGPSINPESKKFWVNGRTQEQRDNVLVPIQTAYDWSQSTGYSTWVGAWMTGNYNAGHDYNIVKQIEFGSFLARSLKEKGIKWSLNAGKHFYDYRETKWYTKTTDAGGIAILDAVLDPEKICIYERSQYRGNSFRLSAGSYTKAQLEEAGLTTAGSIMVPIDYTVSLYPEDNFEGTPVVEDRTIQNAENLAVESLKVEYISLV